MAQRNPSTPQARRHTMAQRVSQAKRSHPGQNPRRQADAPGGGGSGGRTTRENLRSHGGATRALVDQSRYHGQPTRAPNGPCQHGNLVRLSRLRCFAPPLVAPAPRHRMLGLREACACKPRLPALCPALGHAQPTNPRPRCARLASYGPPLSGPYNARTRTRAAPAPAPAPSAVPRVNLRVATLHRFSCL